MSRIVDTSSEWSTTAVLYTGISISIYTRSVYYLYRAPSSSLPPRCVAQCIGTVVYCAEIQTERINWYIENRRYYTTAELRKYFIYSARRRAYHFGWHREDEHERKEKMRGENQEQNKIGCCCAGERERKPAAIIYKYI